MEDRVKSDMTVLTLEAGSFVPDETLAVGPAAAAEGQRCSPALLNRNMARREQKRSVKKYWGETGGTG